MTHRRLLASTLAIVTLCSGAYAVRAQPSQAPEPSPQTPQASPQRPMDAIAASLRRIWWNNPKKIEALGLTEAQRRTMDAELEAFLSERQNATASEREAREAFGAALAGGDREGAETAAERVAEYSSQATFRQANLMISVVSKLTPEQRTQLAENYPMLLKRPWIRQSVMGGGAASQRSRT